MKLSKKALAIFLSAVMIQSAVMTTAISVSAEEETPSEQIVVDVLDDPEIPEDEPIVTPDEQLFGDWSYLETDDCVMVLKYSGKDATVEVPAYIDDKPVVAVGDCTFKCNRTMQTVVIPDSIVTIGNGAFRNCTALENIEGGYGVTKIGNRAFEGCKSLTNFALMYDLQYVGVAAFKDCCALQDIMLYKVKEVSPYAFWGCRSLNYVNSVETIKVGSYAFYGCKNLSYVTIIAGENIDEVLTIEPMAFAGCTALTSVNFHWTDRVEVKPYAFYNCKNIESVYYSGSYERWKENVKISLIGNFYFNKATAYYNNINWAELDEKEKKMTTGETVQLTYHSVPYVGYEDSLNIVSWTSKNPDVAVVDENGNVTAVGVGTAIISLRSSSEKYMDYETFCTITVTQAADSVELNKTAVNVGVGQKYTLKATVSPSDAPQTVKWKTSDKKLAVVSADGVVTAKKAGTVTITATTENGKTATCKVTIKKAPESITLDKETLNLKVNSNYTFKKILSPNSATSYKWTSSNPDVVRVYSTGKIVAQKSGTSVITVTTHNGLTASCTVTVK